LRDRHSPPSSSKRLPCLLLSRTAPRGRAYPNTNRKPALPFHSTPMKRENWSRWKVENQLLIAPFKHIQIERSQVTDLTHAIQFLQAAFTILLSLAFGEAFKQLVPDGDDDMRWDRFWSLLAFIVMIFPFFHGMTRHFYTTYLTHPKTELATVAPWLMFDGIMFMSMSAMFFVMSRSLTPSHWPRFFIAISGLLLVDTVWSGMTIYRGINLWPFICLNTSLFVSLGGIALWYRRVALPSEIGKFSWGPTFCCAIACFSTTTIDYIWMQRFFFNK
jgi:hypothetical protein